MKIWVDVGTFLPVRLEEEIVTKGGNHVHYVSYDFRWNVVVNASDFEPNIPDEYTNPAGEISIPAFTEENAIEGLRLFAGLAKRYPVDPNASRPWREARRLLGSTSSWEELRPLLGLGGFYEELTKDNKDLAPIQA